MKILYFIFKNISLEQPIQGNTKDRITYNTNTNYFSKKVTIDSMQALIDTFSQLPTRLLNFSSLDRLFCTRLSLETLYRKPLASSRFDPPFWFFTNLIMIKHKQKQTVAAVVADGESEWIVTGGFFTLSQFSRFLKNKTIRPFYISMLNDFLC